jgi:type II secretory pathway pseudopilin PulG
MGAAMSERAHNASTRESGFGLLEVIIATVILSVGLLSLLALFTTAVASTQSSQEDEIAHQLAADAMENIFTARDTAQIPFAQVKNVSNGGIFLDGFQPIMQAGVDGLDGTLDDVAAAPPIMLPGPDGILGTPDDVAYSLANFSRQIQITDVLTPPPNPVVNPFLRQLTVTVRYRTPQLFIQQKDYAVVAYISAFR